MSDLSGQRTKLGFSQPVAAERLTPVEVLPLVHESEDVSTKITIDNNGVDKTGVVEAQSIDGRVYVRWEDDPEVQCLDLSRVSYRWI